MAHLSHLFRNFEPIQNRVFLGENQDARREIRQEGREAIRDIREQTREKLESLKSEIEEQLQNFKDNVTIEYKAQRDDVKRKDLVEWMVRDALGQIPGAKARQFAREYIRKNLGPSVVKGVSEGDVLKIQRGRFSIIRNGSEIYGADITQWGKFDVETQGMKEAAARETTPAVEEATVEAAPQSVLKGQEIVTEKAHIKEVSGEGLTEQKEGAASLGVNVNSLKTTLDQLTLLGRKEGLKAILNGVLAKREDLRSEDANIYIVKGWSESLATAKINGQDYLVVDLNKTPEENIAAILAALETLPAQAEALAIPAEEAPLPTTAPNETLDLSQLQVEEALSSFTFNHRYELPEGIARWKNAEFADKFRELTNGEAIIDQLKVLGDLAGIGPMDAWGEMRQRHLESNVITLNEISAVIMGRSAEYSVMRYETVKKLIDKTNNPAKKEALENEKARWETFFIAAAKLGGYLADAMERDSRTLDYNRSGTETTFENKESPDVNTVRQLLGKYFDVTDTGPEFRGLKKGQVTMERYHGHADFSRVSGAAAMRYLEQKIFTRDADGVLQVNEASLNAEIKGLIEKGATLALKPIPNDLANINTSNLKDYLNRYGQYLVDGMALNFQTRLDRQMEFYEGALNIEDLVSGAAGQLGLDPAETQAFEEGVRTQYLAFAGLLMEGKQATAASLDAPFTIQLPNGRYITVSAGFGKSTGGIIPHSFGLHAGISGDIVRTAEGRLNLGAGVGAGFVEGQLAGATAEVGLTAEGNLDKRGEWKINFTGVAGVGVSPRVIGASLYLAAGFNRDPNASLDRRTEQSLEQQKVKIEKALTAYAELNPAGVDTMRRMIEQEIRNEEVEKTGTFQFLGISVGVVLTPVGPLPVFSLGLGVRGKTFALYQSQHPWVSMEDISSAAIQESLKLPAGTELTNVNRAEQTLRADQRDFEDFEQQGVKLTETTTKGTYLLEMPDAAGRISIYNDPRSGIKTEVGADGKVYMKIDESDSLVSVRHALHTTAFKSYGEVENHEIFITNGSGEGYDNESIRARTNDKIVWTQDRGVSTAAIEMQARDNGEARADTAARPEDVAREAALVEAIQRHGVLSEKLSAYFEQTNDLTQVNTERMAQIETWAKTYMKDRGDRLTYKQLSIDGKTTEIDAEIRKELGATLPEAELIFAHQSLMEASLAQVSQDPKERIRHVVEWNGKRLKESILKDVPSDQAERITRTVMAQIEKDLASPDIETNDFIPSGAHVLIEVGTERINGYRTAEWQDDGSLNTGFIMDEVSLSPETIQTKFGLNEEDSKVLIDHLQARLGNVDTENPRTLLESPLGRELVAASSVLFPDHVEAYITILEKLAKGEQPATEAEFDALTLLESAYKALEADGTWTSPDGVKATATGRESMALYKKCMNLTLIADVALTLEMPEKPVLGSRKIEFVKADMVDMLKGSKAVQVIGFGGSVAVGAPRPEPEVGEPERPEHPEEPKPEGEGGKEEGSGVGKGDVDDRNPGTGDQGTVTEPGDAPGNGGSAPADGERPTR